MLWFSFILFFFLAESSQSMQPYGLKPYIYSGCPLYSQREDELYPLLINLPDMDYDFSHLKCKNLDGIDKKYSWYDIDEYCEKTNIKKMSRVINRVRAIGEWYLRKNDLENFVTILRILTCVDEAFRTCSRYECSLARAFHPIQIGYRDFKKSINEIGLMHCKELIDLYVKKKGNLTSLLEKLDL